MKRDHLQPFYHVCGRKCVSCPDQDDDDFFYELLAEMRLPYTR